MLFRDVGDAVKGTKLGMLRDVVGSERSDCKSNVALGARCSLVDVIEPHRTRHSCLPFDDDWKAELVNRCDEVALLEPEQGSRRAAELLLADC